MSGMDIQYFKGKATILVDSVKKLVVHWSKELSTGSSKETYEIGTITLIIMLENKKEKKRKIKFLGNGRRQRYDDNVKKEKDNTSFPSNR